MLRSKLQAAAADKDSDWVQFTAPTWDVYYLRRIGLVNVLREMKGLDWIPVVLWSPTPRLLFTWETGHLTVKLHGGMDGEQAYPVACGRSQKGGAGVRVLRKHNHLAHAVTL